jgi:hypothetical protein
MQEQSSIINLQADYRSCFESLNGDKAGRIAASNYLNASTAIYHDEVIGLGFIPKIYDMPALRFFDSLAKTTYRILEKVTERFLADPDYRKLFCFSPTLERLICLPTGYESKIPIMRMDIFLDEESFEFKFCEFNTDGTSAMNEDREGTEALGCSTTFAQAAPKLALQAQELFDGWVDEFLALYKSSAQAVSTPVIALLDYGTSATMYEFEEFRTRFEARGYRCLICDISSLSYHEGSLLGCDVNPTTESFALPTRIDAVYRRAVTGEILAELEQDLPLGKGAQALVQAVEEQSICMIGGFVSHVAHSKQLCSVLHLPETSDFLDEIELDFIRKHIPYTTRLDVEHVDLSGVKEDKDHWIIKPEDGYGSKGVYAGVDYSKEDWVELIEEYNDQGYILQTYCKQFALPNTRLAPLSSAGRPLLSSADEYADNVPNFDSSRLEQWNVLTGLYVYNGKFSGVYVRAGQKGIIVGFAGGIAVPTFLAGYDQSAGLAVRVRELKTHPIL